MKPQAKSPRSWKETDPEGDSKDIVTARESAPEVIGTDRYTMVEAAKLKGVSYHTVSRAVRVGRLPVQRLGRMALISGEDLGFWHPMRERAPRRYRHHKPEPDASPVFLDTALGERLELAKRLSTLYEIIHSASSELPIGEFAHLVCERMVQVFHLSRGSLWLFDDSLKRATRIASVGSKMTSMPDAIDLDDFPAFQQFATREVVRISRDPRSEMVELRDYEKGATLGPVLALSLQVGSRTIGGFFGDRDGRLLELPEDHLVLARVLANQAALAIDHARLRDQEQSRADQLTAILEHMTVAVRACDEKGRLTFTNTIDREFSGAGEDSGTIGGDAFENHNILARFTLNGEPISGDKHPLARALDGEQIRGWEYDISLAGGTRRRISVNAWPLVVNQQTRGAVYTARDLTAQREAERQAEDRLRKLEVVAGRAETVARIVTEINAVRSVEAALEVTVRRMSDELHGTGGLVLLRDCDGRFTVRATHGMTLPPSLSGPLEPITIPSTILTLARQEPMLLGREEASMAERQLMDSVGARFQLIVPLNIGDRHFGAVYVNYPAEPHPSQVDVTFAATLGHQCVHVIDQIRTVRELETTYRRLTNVMDQLPQGVLIIDEPEAIVSLANQAVQRLWGEALEPGTVPAHELPMIDPDGHVYGRDNHPLLRPFRTGTAYLGEPLTILRSDGSHIDVLGNHSPIFGPDRSIIGVVSLLQDREHFKPLDRAKDEFLSIVAHELRNPLTSLRGNLQLIQRRIRKRGEEAVRDEEFRRIGIVIEQVDRVAELVGRMLDISRVDLGRLDLEFAETDASEILQSVVNSVSGLVPERKMRVTVAERLPVVWDQVRVEQILVNLLTNAVRYAPAGPIDVEARLIDADRVQITVRDFGPGIPARIRRRLFKQYYRFDDGQDDRERTVDGSHGLGIGLYISARLARAHGGSLDVEDAEGGGALFFLTLPRTLVRE